MKQAQYVQPGIDRGSDHILRKRNMEALRSTIVGNPSLVEK
jgi:hypothetical protein